MSREEYLEQLAYLLQDISDQERDEAIEFYRDYFEEAGEGRDANVIATLGSPEKVAAQIKNGLKEEKDDGGEYTEAGYQDERFREDNKVPVPKEEESQQEGSQKSQTEERGWYGQKESSGCQDGYGQNGYGQYDYQNTYPGPVRKRSGLTIGLIVLLCIIASPVLLSVAGILFGVIAAVVGGVIAIAVGAVAITFGALILGIAMFGVGIANLFTVPAVGCLFMGGGLISLAVSILLIIAAFWILGRFVPWVIRGIVHLCSGIFRRGGRRS